MKFFGFRNGHLTFCLSQREAAILANGLGRATLHGTLAESGVSSGDLSNAVSLLEQATTDSLPHDAMRGRYMGASSTILVVRARRNDGDIEIEIGRDNLNLVVALLNEVVNGLSIWEWEFHSLLGYQRSEMRQFFNELHWYAVTPDRDLRAGAPPNRCD